VWGRDGARMVTFLHGKGKGEKGDGSATLAEISEKTYGDEEGENGKGSR